MLRRAFFFFLIRPFVAFFIGLRLRGQENLPSDDPFLLVANHSSHLDTLVILSLFPGHRLRRIRPVAAADYWMRTPLMAWFARTFINILPIARRREDRTGDPREQMIDALKAGDSLVIFPEGTRGRGEEITPFKSGVSDVILACPEVPVAPLALVNLGRSLPKGAWLPVPLFCEVRVGASLRPSGCRDEVLEAVESAVRTLLND